jgi:ribosomal protein S8
MYLQFTVFFYKNTPYYQGIRLVSTLSKKFYISLTALNKLVRLSQSSTYLISTPSGIITHREAILRKTGGILLCAIG